MQIENKLEDMENHLMSGLFVEANNSIDVWGQMFWSLVSALNNNQPSNICGLQVTCYLTFSWFPLQYFITRNEIVFV